ncbi:MAG: carboxypeptidase-like regulatory domain-containing protein [Flavobacteriaceae bacterium]|nr:carboxypeptidase-like regulatory domain-containing protein [Flavobacteriaceae bacterium]
MKKYNMVNIRMILIVASLFFFLFLHGQKAIPVSGHVFDESGFEIPFAAVGIIKKNIGTSTTEDGEFYFVISEKELSDTLQISSLGFETYRVNLRDYLNKKTKIIELVEQTTNLSEVVVTTSDVYVKMAFKKLKENTVSKNHQLKTLYRRWSVEDNLCRFFVEHYINVIDRGPNGFITSFNVAQARTSADYRFIKNEQKMHALMYMAYNNPLRKGMSASAYAWKKVSNSSYDGEDVVVTEGTRKNGEVLRLYIGMDTHKIYKFEVTKYPQVGKFLKATYVYKNNADGKLYLSYHQREWEGAIRLSEDIKRTLRSANRPTPEYIPIAYRHEVYVLGIEENKKLFDSHQQEQPKDMTLYKVPYNANFWKGISIPPNTRFYNQNIGELESLYGVPVEEQFKYSGL